MLGNFARHSGSGAAKVGRRNAARLRLSIPAKLITTYETQKCVLVDVSRTGAQIHLERPLRVGDAGFLRFANMETFVGVVRSQPGGNGLEFDEPLSNDQVLSVRAFWESIEADERQALLNEVRAWVMGGR